MSVQYGSRLSPGTVTVVTTAETVCGSVGPITYDLPNTGTSTPGGAGVALSATINAANSAGVTSATLRIRQGSLSGPVVGIAQPTPATASVSQSFTIDEIDTSRTPAQAGGLAYVVTIQYAGASANTTVNECVMTAQGL